jgi:hypothetical protein
LAAQGLVKMTVAAISMIARRNWPMALPPIPAHGVVRRSFGRHTTEIRFGREGA